MSTRISSALGLLILLTACKAEVRDKVAEARQKAHEEKMANAAGKIECAPPGAEAFGYVCTIDMTRSQDGLFLTLRHPDGGFRRLLVTRDGRGVIAADGAEQTMVATIAPDMIEVAIGSARYRLPATVRQPKTAR